MFYFSEIANAGSIKEAARRLSVSPPTLSEHLEKFERELNVQLFHRQHRKLTLTPQGSRLFLQAKQMFELGRRLIDVVSPIPLGCYPVSIGVVPAPSSFAAHDLVGRYCEKFGPVDLKIHRASRRELEKRLVQADFDFAFTDEAPERKDLVTRKIATTTLKFYVTARNRGQSLDMLLQTLPVIICTDDPTVRSATENALMESDFHPSATIETDVFAVALGLCRQGHGIGVFTEEAIQNDSEPLIEVPNAPALEHDLFAVWTHDAENTQAVKNLRSLLERKPASQARKGDLDLA